MPVRLIALLTCDVSFRDPFLAGSSLDRGVGVHRIDVFEGERFSLEEEEEDNGRSDEVASKEHQAEAEVDALCRVGSKESEEKVAFSMSAMRHNFK